MVEARNTFFSSIHIDDVCQIRIFMKPGGLVGLNFSVLFLLVAGVGSQSPEFLPLLTTRQTM